jgi:hypothetical protein
MRTKIDFVSQLLIGTSNVKFNQNPLNCSRNESCGRTY